MANQKISELNELTTPTSSDILAIVDDPSGSPETKKITFGNIELNIDHIAIQNIGTNTHAQIDTAITSLTNDSMADALHRHSELSASDGTPDAIVSVDATGQVKIEGVGDPLLKLKHLSAGDPALLVEEADSGQSIFTIAEDITTGAGEVKIYNGAGGTAINLDANGTCYVNNTNNFGLGTATPQAKLEVAWDKGEVYLGEWGWGADYAAIGLAGSIDGTEYNFLSSKIDKNLYINRPTDENIFFREGGANQVTIAAGGNVGIGIVTPNEALTLGADGVLSIDERAAAPTATAAYGKLWVKNTVPCELWFTDDAGTSTKII